MKTLRIRNGRYGKLAIAGILGAATSLAIGVAPAFAASAPSNTNGPIEFPEWKMASVSSPYWYGGPWQNGPQGVGPATLGISQTIGVSNSASGNLQVSDSVLSSAVGYSVTDSYQETSEYSVSVPAGDTYEIFWRNWYQKKTVTQDEYAPPSYSTVVGTATCYAQQWNHFGYKWENIG